jgi:hypothetical protein
VGSPLFKTNLQTQSVGGVPSFSETHMLQDVNSLQIFKNLARIQAEACACKNVTNLIFFVSSMQEGKTFSLYIYIKVWRDAGFHKTDLVSSRHHIKSPRLDLILKHMNSVPGRGCNFFSPPPPPTASRLAL